MYFRIISSLAYQDEQNNPLEIEYGLCHFKDNQVSEIYIFLSMELFHFYVIITKNSYRKCVAHSINPVSYYSACPKQKYILRNTRYQSSFCIIVSVNGRFLSMYSLLAVSSYLYITYHPYRAWLAEASRKGLVKCRLYFILNYLYAFFQMSVSHLLTEVF